MKASPPMELLAELSHPFEAELLRQVLERHEIVCFVEGINSASNLATKTGVGAIRLWVAAIDLPAARELLDEAQQARHADWYCEVCEEWVGAGFDWCWKCGGPRSTALAKEPAEHFGDVTDKSHESARDQPTAATVQLEDQVSRAWRASVIGLILLPVLLHVYSCVLLVQSLAIRADMDRRLRFQFAGALLINVAVFAFVAYVLIYLLRG